LTAAIVGFHTSRPLSYELMVGISQNDPGHVPADPAGSFMSAPAQNDSPPPVTMPTHASSSSRNSCHAALRSFRISALMALRTSGRLYVIVVTCPSRS
jgi:hypothetical protein